MNDSMSSKFVMYGSREAMESGAEHIKDQIEAIEKAIEDQPSYAFDLASTIIESICLNILEKRSISHDKTNSLPSLVKKITKNIPCLLEEGEGVPEAEASLKKTLGGLTRTVHGICELRNKFGFASHGSSGPRPEIEATQAYLVAEAADAIVGFLYRMHRQDQDQDHSRPLEYGHNPSFNAEIDEIHGSITICDTKFNPSEILFNLEQDTYRIHLAEFLNSSDEEASE